MRVVMLLLACAWLAGTLAASAAAPPSSTPSAPPAPRFDKDIKPILWSHCIGCHRGGRARADVVLTNYKGVMAGKSKTGNMIVVPGKPNESWLQKTIEGHRPVMPPRGSSDMTREEITQVRAWILAGAKND